MAMSQNENDFHNTRHLYGKSNLFGDNLTEGNACWVLMFYSCQLKQAAEQTIMLSVINKLQQSWISGDNNNHRSEIVNIKCI